MKRLSDFVAGAKGFTLVGLLASAFLVACGGDNNNVSESERDTAMTADAADAADIVVDAFSDLKVCGKKLDGKTAYVKEEELTYRCEGGHWKETSSGSGGAADIVVDAFVELKVCGKKLDGKTAYVKEEELTYLCEDGHWEEVTSSSSEKIKSSSSSLQQDSVSVVSDQATTWSASSAGSTYDDVNNILTDLRDSQTYRTVKIGDQVWMAENLNFRYLQRTKTLDSSSFCYSGLRCEIFGRYYLWSAAMDSAAVFSTDGKDCGSYSECVSKYPTRGVCPAGWHLPSESDWITLIETVGGGLVAGEVLKSNKWNGSDDYQFSALLAGYGSRYASTSSDGDRDSFRERDTVAYFWTATRAPSTIKMQAKESAVQIRSSYTHMGNSVRCLKDNDSDAMKSNDSVALWNWDMLKDVRPNPGVNYGSLTDSRDGQVYRTVKIGSQVWMAENLNYRGSDVHYTCYDDQPENCEISSVLYSFFDFKNLCPNGWHLPSRAEWETLFEAVGGKSVAGRMLRSQGGWPTIYKGDDPFGFSALPAGVRHYTMPIVSVEYGTVVDPDGNAWFDDIGEDAVFWTSDPNGSINANAAALSYDESVAGYWSLNRCSMIPVRCVEDAAGQQESSSSSAPDSSSSSALDSSSGSVPDSSSSSVPDSSSSFVPDSSSSSSPDSSSSSDALTVETP